MMIVVGRCWECGAPIWGSPYANDAMSGVTFPSCSCEEADGYEDSEYCEGMQIIGSGDFEGWGAGR